MLSCKLDWLAFTWKSQDDFCPNEFENFLRAFPEIEECLSDCVILRECSSTFYDHVLAFNEMIQVSFRDERMNGKNSDVNLGVNVSVPAHGLEYFFNLMHYDINNVVGAIKDLDSRGCHFSRLDFAFDDYEKVFTPNDYISWYVNGQLVTNFRKARFIASTKSAGCTFYLGSRSNGRLLRIYDKDYESKGNIKAIRYEFELHGKHTEKYVSYICNKSCLPAFRSILSEWIIKIVRTCAGENRRSGEVLPEWNDFCVKLGSNALEKISATSAIDTKDPVIKKLRWFNDQVLPSINDFVNVLGIETVISMIRESGFSVKHELIKNLWEIQPEKYKSLFDSGWKSSIYRCE